MFLAKSLYNKMQQGATVAHAKDIWKIAALLKVRSSSGSWRHIAFLQPNNSRSAMGHLMAIVCCVPALKM
jgi:hypothetical protein